ncbi:sce7726 family protein [Arcobacter cryaerophilus gv. pseudocryaerophilus]|uniref:Sce7726 family protein n=3 Tax=unclassified Arcobacter TaxID=2593671 RepID=A0AA96RBC8_9BACT|nr:sce7726 family protein [Arcobacter sp. AZ-2023]WPD04832.1 sce7726 family protein [Arcobacter sp. DSM 115956]WPD06927.1 sce7726 family protein [Arcobacter sp. DSM 115955]WNL31192.1 sce7726 family protein [Arcobacter sp. AZ-2023]WNP37342.1 sce7726 family protein [Arcobacter sp. AZ-2023]
MKANARIITNSLIEYLDKKYTNKTITTEISVNTSLGVKVVDVLVSNGHSVAFEIKSEVDTIKRLDSQVKGYSEIFDYVYLVYWKDKFDIKDIELPENIGVITADWNIKQTKIKFDIIRSAKINRIADQKKIASLLWKDEIFYFLSKKNIYPKKSYTKDILTNIFEECHTKTEAIKIFRFVLKKRFEKGFIKYQESKKTPDCLDIFKNYKVDFNYLSYLK